MKAILNPSKTEMRVLVRHYTKHSLSVWLQLWERKQIEVLYTTCEWDEHNSCYGSNWIEFELKLEFNKQVPYKMGLTSTPSTEWGWKEDKGWFHTPICMMRMIRTSN